MARRALLPVIASALLLVQGGWNRAAAQSQAYDMPYERCLVAIRNTAQRLDRRPEVLVDEPGRKVVRFAAEDGIVRVGCYRDDSQMIITREGGQVEQ